MTNIMLTCNSVLSNQINMNKKYYCCITHKEIPPSRAKALLELGVPENEMTSIEIAQTMGRKRFGVFAGEDIIFCDAIGEEFNFNESESDVEDDTD